jgi:chitinase
MVRMDSSGAFDPDGHAFVRGWRQTGGTPVTLLSTTAVSPTFTPMRTGVFGFALIVTDTFGLSSAPDSVVVTSTNRAPVAIVGGDQVVTPGALVTLDGSASFDPDQHNIEFAWVQVAGDTLALSNAVSPKPTFTAPEVAQTLRFELVVSDSFGLASLPQSTSVMVQTTTPSFELYLPVIQGNR